MSVTSAKPKHQPFQGSDTLTSGKVESEYRIVYIVNTSRAEDNSLTVLNSSLLPQLGSQYNYGGVADKTATLTRKEPNQTGPTTWEVTCVWTGMKSEGGEEEDNPLKARVKRSWRTAQEETYPLFDLDGKAIRNSAGHPFDAGVPMVRHYSVYVIERNEASFQTELAVRFVGAVNSTGWHDHEPGTVKLIDMSAEEQYWEPKKLWYVTVHYELAVKPEGWDPRLVDKGPFYYKVDEETKAYRKFFTEVDSGTGTEVTREFLLNGNGEKLSDERAKSGQVEWLRFKVHPRASFGSLRL